MSISSAASSSLGPSTPLPPSTGELPITPSRDSFSSPPDSLKQYRTAMKEHATAAWAAALKDLKDHSDVGSRRKNPHYGFDENPFDRKAMEYLSPTKPYRLQPPTEQRSRSYLEAEEKLRLMLLGLPPDSAQSSSVSERGADEMDVDMARSNCPSPSPSPSPANTFLSLPADVDSPTPGSSNYMQTPFSVAASAASTDRAPAGAGPSRRPIMRNVSWLRRESSYGVGAGADTPGSTFSESSFEAMSDSNYFSMYGRQASSSKSTSQGTGSGDGRYALPMPPPPRPDLHARLSSETGNGLGLALSGVDLNRNSVASTNTITSLSSASTFTSSTSSTSDASTATATATAAVHYTQAVTLKAARPSLKNPRPTPYPPTHPHTPRRSRVAVAMEDGDESMDNMEVVEEEYAEEAEAAAEEDAEEDDWIHGRSVSEEMVARAGLRCQRGRGIQARP